MCQPGGRQPDPPTKGPWCPPQPLVDALGAERFRLEKGSIFRRSDLALFHTMKPEAEVHLLLIPAAHVKDAEALERYGDSKGTYPLQAWETLRLMHNQADVIMKALTKAGFGVHRPFFHKPGYTSVSHLHMHILAGKSHENQKYRIELPSDHAYVDALVKPRARGVKLQDQDVIDAFLECVHLTGATACRLKGNGWKALARKNGTVWALADRVTTSIPDGRADVRRQGSEERVAWRRRELGDDFVEIPLFHGTRDIWALGGPREDDYGPFEAHIQPSMGGQYGPGCYFVEKNGLFKAAWFSRRLGYDDTGHLTFDQRKPQYRDSDDYELERQGEVSDKGHIIGYRVAVRRAKCLTDKEGDRWYGDKQPEAVVDENLILGFARNGHSSVHADADALNKLPEFCLLDPNFAEPVFVAEMQF